jgi:hypothetical protein
LFRTIRHSSSDRWSGYDIFSVGDELKKEEMKWKGINFGVKRRLLVEI